MTEMWKLMSDGVRLHRITIRERERERGRGGEKEERMHPFLSFLFFSSPLFSLSLSPSPPFSNAPA
jgi:hypothetical protein